MLLLHRHSLELTVELIVDSEHSLGHANPYLRTFPVDEYEQFLGSRGPVVQMRPKVHQTEYKVVGTKCWTVNGNILKYYIY